MVSNHDLDSQILRSVSYGPLPSCPCLSSLSQWWPVPQHSHSPGRHSPGLPGLLVELQRWRRRHSCLSLCLHQLRQHLLCPYRHRHRPCPCPDVSRPLSHRELQEGSEEIRDRRRHSHWQRRWPRVGLEAMKLSAISPENNELMLGMRVFISNQSGGSANPPSESDTYPLKKLL